MESASLTSSSTVPGWSGIRHRYSSSFFLYSTTQSFDGVSGIFTLRSSSGRELKSCGARTKNEFCRMVLTQSSALRLHFGSMVVLRFIGIRSNPGLGHSPMIILYMYKIMDLSRRLSTPLQTKDPKSLESLPVVDSADHHSQCFIILVELADPAGEPPLNTL